jgi:HK97 family phage major capsid protein
MADVKKKKQELAQLSADAKKLYADMEAHEELRTPDNRQKFENYIEAGKTLRAEIDQLETLEEIDAYTAQPAGEDGKNGSKPNPVGGDGEFSQKFTSKSYGQMVLESDQFKNANKVEGKMASVPAGDLISRFGRKAIYNTADAQGGYAVRADRERDIIDIARQRPFTILDLITIGQTAVDAVEYILFASRTNNAVVVPEWDAAITPGVGDYSQKFGNKPQGDLTLDLKTAVVKTIAEWIPASRQILNDAPNLRSMIDNELMYQIEFVLENEVLTGDGTGNHFTGITATAGIQSRVHAVSGRAFNAADTLADTLRRAMTDIALEFYEADGVVLNPADGEKLELLKGSDGHYVQIFDPVAMRVWRKPVRESVAITAGTGLVGAFRIGAKLWDREQSNIRVGEPGNFFLQNAVAILAELRAAFAVVRPKAIEKITGIV